MIKQSGFLIFAFSSAVAWAQGTSFVRTISSNPINLFPVTSSDGVSNRVSSKFYESLLDRHWDTYEWKPALAKSWKVSDDGKEFVFVLDPKAKFSDGSPVTADDVKFSYDVIFMKGVDSAPQKPYYEQIQSVQVLSPDSIKFATKEKYYKNFDVVAGLTIFSKSHIMKLYAQDKSLAKPELTKNVLGSGPWLLDKWDNNQRIVLKHNPNYWNKEALQARNEWNYDTMVYRIIPEQTVAFEVLKKGELTLGGMSAKQWALQSNSPEIAKKITKIQTVNKEPKPYSYIAWNQTHPILKDKDVRWALGHLVNLPLWVKKFDFNLTEPTIGPYSVKSDEHDPSLKPVAFDLALARKRLAAAGWTQAGPDGFLVKDGKKLELTIVYPTQSKETLEPKLSEYKNQAAKVGVSLLLKSVEWTSFVKLTDERKFDAVILSWSRDIDGDQKQIWHSSSIANQGSNFVSYSSFAVNKLIDEHRTTLDRAKRIDLARAIQRQIYEDQPYTFLTEPKYTLYAHAKNVDKKVDSYQYSIGEEFWKLGATKSLPQ